MILRHGSHNKGCKQAQLGLIDNHVCSELLLEQIESLVVDVNEIYTYLVCYFDYLKDLLDESY